MTNDELIAAYDSHQRYRGFSPATAARRTWTLGKLVDHVDHVPLLAVDRDQIEAFLSPYARAQTRYSMRSDIKMFFKWAVNRDMVEANPTDKVESPRLPTRAATPTRRDDLERTLDSATSRQRVAILLGAYAGLRVSEIANLRFEDIRPDDGLLVVRNGKGGKDRTVPLAPRLAAELGYRLSKGASGPVVPYGSGQKVGAAIRRAFREVGVVARPHDLRHTFGTEAAKVSGGNVVLVAQLMGHAAIQTTQRYIGWTPAGGATVDEMYA